MKTIDLAFLLFGEGVLIFGSSLMSLNLKIPFWKALVWWHLLIIALGLVAFIFVSFATAHLIPKK